MEAQDNRAYDGVRKNTSLLYKLKSGTQVRKLDRNGRITKDGLEAGVFYELKAGSTTRDGLQLVHLCTEVPPRGEQTATTYTQQDIPTLVIWQVIMYLIKF